jgi:hypothetical protein
MGWRIENPVHRVVGAPCPRVADVPLLAYDPALAHGQVPTRGEAPVPGKARGRCSSVSPGFCVTSRWRRAGHYAPGLLGQDSHAGAAAVPTSPKRPLRWAGTAGGAVRPARAYRDMKAVLAAATPPQGLTGRGGGKSAGVGVVLVVAVSGSGAGPPANPAPSGASARTSHRTGTLAPLRDQVQSVDATEAGDRQGRVSNPPKTQGWPLPPRRTMPSRTRAFTPGHIHVRPQKVGVRMPGMSWRTFLIVRGPTLGPSLGLSG